MTPSDNLKNELQDSITAFSAAFMAIHTQTMIDGLDALFSSFSEWGIPSDAVLVGIQTALENNYGVSVIAIGDEGDQE